MLTAMSLFAWGLSNVVYWALPAVRKYKHIDLKIFDTISLYHSPANIQVMQFVTKLAKHQFLVPANLSLIFYFLFIRRHSWFSIRIATVAISSLSLMLVFKQLFRRRRPDMAMFIARGLSFPSGHAMMSATFYGVLIYIIRRTASDPALRCMMITSLLALIVLIGFSRVFFRVHYASDVLAGFIIGLIWLYISLSILERIEQFNKQINLIPQNVEA
jgi:membrane-associated phospholipid phosphatase